MERIGLSKLFLSRREREKLTEIYNKEKEKCQDSLSVWFTLSVLVNILPVIVAFLFNIAQNNVGDWIFFANSGAVSLVGYNIVISAIFYLLDATKVPHENLKKKLLGIGILMLFLNISLFTFQATNTWNLNCIVLYVTFGLSLLFLILTIASSRYMVVLQKEIIGERKDHLQSVNRTRETLHQKSSTRGKGDTDDVEY